MDQAAIALFTKVFLNLLGRTTEVRRFRKIVELGLSYASEDLSDDGRDAARDFFTNPTWDKVFKDKQSLMKHVGGFEGMAGLLASNDLATFQLSVDAASLVFMHSALDAAAQDLCRVCALVAPADWEEFVRDKKVSLSEIRLTTYQALLEQRVAEHLEDLERQFSLVRKVDRLFQVCQPRGVKRENYVFDRERLENLDNDRHDVIHGDGVVLKDVDHSLEYLSETGLFLIQMVNQRYDVRVDPELAAARGFGWGRLIPNPLSPPA